MKDLLIAACCVGLAPVALTAQTFLPLGDAYIFRAMPRTSAAP